jgi:uncharacterized phage protein gp47/JayE
MPITYGLSETGFLAKPTDVVAAEVDTSLKGILGESAGSNADGTIPLNSKAGQIKTLLAAGIGELWDLLQAIYSSFNPASATGSALDAVASITGTLRTSAFYSQVTATLTGTPSTSIPAGRVATVTGTGSRFASVADGTIGSLSSWAGTNGYTVGDRVTNGSSPARAYQCITTGTSAGSGGPTTTAADITDGSVHWKYLGAGTGAVDIAFKAEVAGPIAAIAGALATIATPVSGWSTVTNILAAAPGDLKETDPHLRVKREEELAAGGNATEKAIQGAVLEASTDLGDPVTACSVFYNDTGVTDGFGVPAHSIEVLATGGSNNDVAQAILDSVAAGIGTYGSVNVTRTDASGNDQIINFNRPTAVPIYVRADVTYDPKAFPVDLTAGAILVKDAIATFGGTYKMGESVRASHLIAAVFDSPTSTMQGATPVPGVLDVTILYIDDAPTPTTAVTVAISRRQLATFDIANITVNLLEGAP